MTVTEPQTTTEITVVPPEGAYLTDGKRLAQVIGMTEKQEFILEDCSCPTDAAPEHNRPILVPPGKLGLWRVVRPEAPDAAA